MNSIIKDYKLNNDEYYQQVFKKDTIVIHHTAGSHHPEWTIQSWEHDRNRYGGSLPVATAYVIGGSSTSAKDTQFNGKVYRCFDDIYWAHHIGMTSTNNSILNRKSVAIEICNWGCLTLGRDGQFYNYVSRVVPQEQVYKLDVPFRGFTYYHKYTDEQIEALRLLLLDLCTKHGIDKERGLKELINTNFEEFAKLKSLYEQQRWLNRRGITDMNGQQLTEDGVIGAKTLSAIEKLKKLPKYHYLDINVNARNGRSGIYTHTNYILGKTDIHPQPEIIKMLQNL